MKKFFLLLMLALPFMMVQAQDGAEITFDSETVDYGTIDNGADGERMFVFTNTGNEPLIITNCKGSCGCTVPKCPKEPIMPGETGEIKVKYDTKRTGAFTKTITVNSNASNGTKIVKIKGTVNAPSTGSTSPVKGADSPVKITTTDK